MRESEAARLDALSARDRAYWRKGIVFAGVDEVGRGPLAGPVMAGCVVMPPDHEWIPYVNDSKKVTEKRRPVVCEAIEKAALFAKVAIATVEEIDALNILEATKLAMRRATEGAPCDIFLVDGNMEGIALPGMQYNILQGDANCYSIAAASILAKVARDRLMVALDAEYPGYGFAKNKGYGTREHMDAIRAQGICPAHRALFVRKLV